MTTPADLDHQGGNDAVKRTSPATMVCCGEADRELVENPASLFGKRYNFLKEEHQVGFESEHSPAAASQLRMDRLEQLGQTKLDHSRRPAKWVAA